MIIPAAAILATFSAISLGCSTVLEREENATKICQYLNKEANTTSWMETKLTYTPLRAAKAISTWLIRTACSCLSLASSRRWIVCG
jgi:hypothetical protein